MHSEKYEERVWFKWTKLNDLSVPRASHVIFIHNNRMYIALGEDVDCQFAEQVSSKLVQYSFITKELSYTDFKLKRMFSTHFQKDNLIYFFGGFEELTDYSTNYCEIYLLDMATKKLEKLETKNPPWNRRYHCSTFMNDKLYVFGGENDVLSCSLNDFYCLDIKTLEWSFLISRNSKTPSRRRYSSLASKNNLVYLFGGRDENERMDDFWVFDVMLEEWNLLETYGDKPKPITCPTPVVQGWSIFYFGGNLAGNSCNYLWEFHIPTSTWKFIDAYGQIPTPRYWNAVLLTEFNEMIIHGGYDTRIKKNIGDTFKIFLPKRNKNLKFDLREFVRSNIYLDVSVKFV